MKQKLNQLLLLVAMSFVFSSCMTVFRGTKQTVSFNSEPPGAELYINGSSTNLITPCEYTITKKVPKGEYNRMNEYIYTFRKENYETIEIRDYRNVSGGIWGNCLTLPFFPIAMGVDFLTGAAFTYRDEVNVKLIPDEAAKDNKPPVISIIKPKAERGFVQIQGEKQLLLKFTVEDENLVSYVSVNNIKLVENEAGFYQVTLSLHPGENTIKIKAIDSRDNVANEIITARYERKKKREEDYPINISNIDISEGKFYALIIGINEYNDPSIMDLSNPVHDAEKLYKVLTNRYTFPEENVRLLRNPTMKDITAALENYFNMLTDNDNLLIFYAGHGYWDQKFKQGYWLPADAIRENRGTWIPNSIIRDYMRGIPSRHTLLITDACFSGGIFKSRDAFKNASIAIKQLYQLPSRKAMTSGTLTEVPDKSVFIEYLIKRLEENQQEFLPSEQLFASFKIAVINNSPNAQVPQFGEVRETGDEGGDFIFVLKRLVSE